MIEDRRAVAVIPARGGSKGLPRKNIADLGGKPLIAYTIEAANGSKYLDRVIFSTDDREIAEVARKWGADVPFLRPKELALDSSSAESVLQHAVKWLREKGGVSPDIVVLLLPTAPLREAVDIDRTIEEFLKHPDADSAVSVCEAEHPPMWTGEIQGDGKILFKFLQKSRVVTRRQELPKAYRLNGAVYATAVKTIMEKDSRFGSRVYPYIMPQEKSIDIDSGLDLKMAEVILKSRRNGK